MRTFGHAIEGIAYLIRTQRNFRIHLLAAAFVAAAGLALGLGATEWAILIVTIALVIMTEAINTGIELAVTLASPERRPEAKAAKDIAAGAVLLSAIAAVLVGLALFAPRLVAIIHP
ncbi:MAG: diacylglycerol kinase family protein [Chloroflexota bacterium]